MSRVCFSGHRYRGSKCAHCGALQGGLLDDPQTDLEVVDELPEVVAPENLDLTACGPLGPVDELSAHGVSPSRRASRNAAATQSRRFR